MNHVLGLAPQRSLPGFAPSLYRWFARRQAPAQDPARPKVVLFADCFMTYNEPRIGRAAVSVLESLGYSVELPKVGCCGRAMISMGLLEDAIHAADATLPALRPYIDDQRVKAIIVCEPSCLATMKDEWLQLKLNTDMDLRKRLAAKAIMPDEFVEAFWADHPVKPPVPQSLSNGAEIVLHGHCHQKALWGEQTSAAALRRVIGAPLTVLPSGCCGMAGSFGYARERYELSMKIGEQSLFALLRRCSSDAIIAAPGTSCRHQIKDGTGRTALHPVEVIAQAMLSPTSVRGAHGG
jgi:Fe-S oxidoreductase